VWWVTGSEETDDEGWLEAQSGTSVRLGLFMATAGLIFASPVLFDFILIALMDLSLSFPLFLSGKKKAASLPIGTGGIGVHVEFVRRLPHHTRLLLGDTLSAVARE
jgi:hypothetical protein